MLKPINAQTQAPLGIFDIDPLWLAAGVEGGYLGTLKADGYGIMVSAPIAATVAFPTVTAGNFVVGLVDDSSTGAGYSTMFGSVQPRNAAASVVGPNTIIGSGKCTIWTQAGLYITDVMPTGYVAGTTASNVLLYATVDAGSGTTAGAGKLTLSQVGAPVGRLLCKTGTLSGTLESLVSPVVDTIDGGNQFYLIYYFGMAA